MKRTTLYLFISFFVLLLTLGIFLNSLSELQEEYNIRKEEMSELVGKTIIVDGEPQDIVDFNVIMSNYTTSRGKVLDDTYVDRYFEELETDSTTIKNIEYE